MPLGKTGSKNHLGIIAGLLLAILLWGGNNASIKFLVKSWPPITVGSTRFIIAGLLMFALLRWTNLLGRAGLLSPELRRSLWWRGGFSLAAYTVVFNFALRWASASHVALYLAVAPVWALLLEGRSGYTLGKYFKCFLAAVLALVGVAILFLPALKSTAGTLRGEFLALVASVLWTNYGRQCRLLGATLSGAEITAHTMWRAGLLMLPLAIVENIYHPIHLEPGLLLAQSYCILAGGITAFALWNHALRHWKTSEVFLFGNLIPVSTMLWAHFTLGETISPTFWFAMAFIVSGVLIGQADWQKIFGNKWLPSE